MYIYLLDDMVTYSVLKSRPISHIRRLLWRDVYVYMLAALTLDKGFTRGLKMI